MFGICFLNITRKSRNFHAFTQAYLAHAQTNFPAAGPDLIDHSGVDKGGARGGLSPLPILAEGPPLWKDEIRGEIEGGGGGNDYV